MENAEKGCKEEIERLNEVIKQFSFQNQMLINWVNGAVITVDAKGYITSASEFALNDVGWDADEFTGKHLHESVQYHLEDGGEYPWEFSPIFAAIEDGSSHHVDGEVFWHKDGSSFKVDYIVSPTRDEKNQVAGALIIFRNLTAQKLEEAKRIQGMKLESIGELSAGIAHEINTPIQFIGNNVTFLQESFNDLLQVLEAYNQLNVSLKSKKLFQETLADIDELIETVDLEYLREETPAAFEQTLDGVNRVTKLVLGLKGFTHSGSTEHKVAHDINEIIQNAIIVCKNSYKYVADLHTEFADLPVVDVFAGDIGQVMVNLIINAAHAVEKKNQENDQRGLITIKSFLKDEKIVVTVADTGTGIPQKIHERIFDPFFTTKDVGQGTGQGLAISRTIIHDKHSGELFFESTEGEGTVFSVCLPVR